MAFKRTPRGAKMQKAFRHGAAQACPASGDQNALAFEQIGLKHVVRSAGSRIASECADLGPTQSALNGEPAEFQLTTNVETASVRLPEKWPFPQRRRKFEPAKIRNINASTNRNTIPPNTSHIDFPRELISVIGELPLRPTLADSIGQLLDAGPIGDLSKEREPTEAHFNAEQNEETSYRS